MGLREEAEKDLGNILSDASSGFGYSITVTSPSLTSVIMTGFSNDISVLIDPDTGMAVSGRAASVAISMRALLDEFGDLPVGISNELSKPWIIQFNNIVGGSHTFKVMQSNPDRAIGIVTCLLESYG